MPASLCCRKRAPHHHRTAYRLRPTPLMICLFQLWIALVFVFPLSTAFTCPSLWTPVLSSHTRLFAKGGKKKKRVKDNTIAVNRIAYRNYEVIETLEAGVSLQGTEVKSIRDGKMNLRDGYIKPDKFGRCTLHNVHISKHSQSAEYFQHEETRVRPLLLHKSEARKLAQKVDTAGLTVVPLKAYFNDKNIVKFQIALVKGKNLRDKRATIKEREGKREANRMIKNFRIQ